MHRHVLIILMLAFLVAGCSNGNSPVVPGQGSASLDTVPVIDLSQTGDTFNAIGLLGAYEVNVDLDNHTAELVAKRDAAIGEGYIVSGINFFTMAPCTSCLQLVGLDFIPGEALVLNFSIQHPFAPGNTAEPPTAANRLDLDVFDVAAVIAPHEATEFNFPLTGASIYSDLAANPDGYTKELQALLNDNNALPYFLVIDDNEDAANTWNKLAMGASAEFDIDFSLTSGGFSFDMYLTFGYGFSARRLQRLTPKYFNPEFNRNAAWKVKVVPPGPAEMGFTWQDNDDTMEYGVEVHVWDWQQGATIYGDPADFENAPNNNIYASSDVASVSVEIIGMTSTLPSETVPDSGTGTPDDPLVYIISITNENLLAPGEYAGLVKVLDDRAPGTIGERDFMIDTPDGILLDNYAIPEFATYQSFVADVVQGCGPITGEILDPPAPITDATNNATINFTVLASSDNDGDPVVLYEVDYDYDGVTFNVADSNTNGVFNNVGPFTVPDPCDDNVPTDFTVAFRATDSCDPANVTIFATTTVTVTSCLGIVGQVTIKTNRTSGSNTTMLNTATPWTLSWDPADGAVEYAIYRDNNPVDGLDNNMVFLGATTNTTYTVPSTELPTNRYVVGSTYAVRSRAIAGDAGSEAPNSNLAFITVNGWETHDANQVINGEGWRASVDHNPTVYYYSPNVTGFGIAHGARSVYWGPYPAASGGQRWAGMTKETPSVTNSTVRWLEMGVYFGFEFAPAGFMFGTSSALPPMTGWSDTEMVTWASVSDGSGYHGYNEACLWLGDIFTGVPSSGRYGWAHSGVYTQTWGGDLNIDGDPDDEFVGLYQAQMTNGNWPMLYLDEVVIAIY